MQSISSIMVAKASNLNMHTNNITTYH
jgi:hypothetical protein